MLPVRRADLYIKRGHPFVVGEAKEFGQKIQALLATFHEQVAGLRVVYIVIVRGLKHAHVLFDQKDIFLYGIVHCFPLVVELSGRIVLQIMSCGSR